MRKAADEAAFFVVGRARPAPSEPSIQLKINDLKGNRKL
jgi:hypothetical protein